MEFFSVRHNSHVTDKFPWINKVISGLFKEIACKTCGAELWSAIGDIEVILDEHGCMWSDVLGCGSYPFLIVSDRVLDLWRGIVGSFPHHSVNIVGDLPTNLHKEQPPKYYWVDGAKMRGALVDFEASGYVGVKFCPECGKRTHDIEATYDLQHSRSFPFVFVVGSWNGANLFTTDLSPTAFFCTDKVLDSARENRLTNFRFLPAKTGRNPKSKGIAYLP